MVFVFDLDDTICDTDKYSEEYILEYIKEHNLPYHQIAKVTRFAESKFDWDRETANKWYKAHGDEMMAHFPLKHKALEVINSLYDLGHTIVIATARSNDWHTDAIGVTNKWLESIGLKYTKAFIGRGDKENICREVDADIFVDDDIDIVTRVQEYFDKNKPNAKALLSITPYNESKDIQRGITKLFNLLELPSIAKPNK